VLQQGESAFLARCVALAKQALEAGDEPFGSVLVLDGEIVYEDRNRVGGGDHTQHPEFAIARWAANHLTREERARSVVYTSGEHCPMCSAAHGWTGLGRIVFASSADQLGKWLAELKAPAAPITMLSINDIVPNIEVVGPIPEFAEQIKQLHQARRF